MKVRFWGVRGSFAATGPEFLRYGGNTTAVEVQSAAGHRLLIDLGTGATEFAKELMAAEFGQGQGRLTILLSHTHIDHIQGLPFFTPFFIKGNRICILGTNPGGGSQSLQEILQRQLNPHYSPLYGLENLAAQVTPMTVTSGDLEVEGFDVRCAAMPHGGMQTMAFRIQADGATFTFMSDIEHPETGPFTPAVDLARDTDLLVHDAMFTDDEYADRQGWGHSSVGAAIACAEAAGARTLALFHHSPDARDEEIDALVSTAATRTGIPVFGAAEGPAFEVTPGGLRLQ